MMMARPKSSRAHVQRREQRAANAQRKQIERQMRKKKKRKGMWACCVPTFATMGVVCLMWLPKIFLTLGIAFTIAGMILMILGSQEHLRYDSGRTSGAVLLGFGIVFVVISSIGLYLKRLMRSVPDPDTGEQRYEIRFEDRKEVYQVEDDYRRPKSALSHTLPNATKTDISSTGGARPKTTQNGRPSTANGNINMSNGRPGSASVRSENERNPPKSARSTGRPTSARSHASDSSKSPRPGSSTARSSVQPDSSRSKSLGSPKENKTPRIARSAIEDDDEISVSRDKPFVTRSSASLNSSLGSSGGFRAQVEVHAPPAINIISDTSFSNKGFEDDSGDNISIHPLATLDAEAADVLARSAPPSPMFTPRHLQKEIVVSDELSDDDDF